MQFIGETKVNISVNGAPAREIILRATFEKEKNFEGKEIITSLSAKYSAAYGSNWLSADWFWDFTTREQNAQIDRELLASAKPIEES